MNKRPNLGRTGLLADAFAFLCLFLRKKLLLAFTDLNFRGPGAVYVRKVTCVGPANTGPNVCSPTPLHNFKTRCGDGRTRPGGRVMFTNGSRSIARTCGRWIGEHQRIQHNRSHPCQTGLHWGIAHPYLGIVPNNMNNHHHLNGSSTGGADMIPKP